MINIVETTNLIIEFNDLYLEQIFSTIDAFNSWLLYFIFSWFLKMALIDKYIND